MSKQANLMFKVSLKLWCHVISTLIHLGFLEPSEYGFAVCVYKPTVQSQWVGSGRETEGAFKVFTVG